MDDSGTFHDQVSRRAYMAHALGRYTLKPILTYAPLTPRVAKVLDILDRSIARIPVSRLLTKEIISAPDWQAMLLTPKAPVASSKVVAYFHGGGFFSCGLGTHSKVFQHIALANSIPVFGLDYRQFPLGDYDASVEDCRQGVEYLIEQLGYAPEDIILAGDSAGGGLAVKVAGIFLEQGMVLGGVVALSGWLDFQVSPEEYARWASRDAYIPAKRIPAVVKKILGHDPEPEDSPISSLAAGYPPLLLVCGASEVLRVDSERTFARARTLGIECTVHYFRGGAHAFPALPGLFPESEEALKIVEAFIDVLEGF